MGCRCCKIIQSYIFDPQDVQTPGYINEINNYKFDTLDGRKFKGKPSVEIQVHKNELQSDESQPSIHRNKLNNAKEAVRNQRNAALQEDGLSNRHEKSYVHINGVHPYSNLKSNHNTNQTKEAGRHACSAKGLSQPKECSNANLEAEHPKQPLAATESSQYRQSLTTGENGSATQSATPEAHSNDICSPGPDVSKHASQQRVAGSESPSNNHTHSTQSTEHAVSNEDGDWASCEANRCDSGDRACRTGTLNGCVKDKTVSDSSSPRPRPEASLEAGQVCCGEMNGEFEEEDADIAEALAALEAATAGEEFEEEEEEY